MRRSLVLSIATLLGAAAIPAAQAVQSPVDLPVLHPGVERGGYSLSNLAPAKPSGKILDGAISDWAGESPRFGGTIVTSRGELIYADHLFDAYGAATAKSAEQQRQVDALAAAAPDTYRLDPIRQVPREFGSSLPHTLENVGAGPRADAADLLELRIGATRGQLQVLARTTTMTSPDSTGLLLLVDTGENSGTHDVGFGSGLTTDKAEFAALVRNGAVTLVDLRRADRSPVELAGAAVADPSGYSNAIEAQIPLSAIGAKKNAIGVAAATGLLEAGALKGVSNVAFRTSEPVTIWFEKQQALALSDGSIDGFFTSVDPAALAKGLNQRLDAGPGYHDRIFVSSDHISTEGGQDGVYQHYGLYLPETPRPNAEGDVPLTFWLHWRGGKAHSAGTLSPRIMRDNGEGRGGIVVSPRGRGTSEWYLGEGHVDFNEVWADVFASFPADDDRVYVTGHSMGGWGSYLLSILYPDRFAAAFPVAGPVTQGAWTGADFEGCDDMKYNEASPCYIETNRSDPRTQHTRPLLENLRNVPIAIFQGAIDELVPTSGVTRQVERLVELGYRHRYYLFPAYEHYSHPLVDEWMEGVRYTNQFVRDPNPAQVSYIRSMPFERSVESGPNQQDANPGLTNFDFDRAYWMSGLTPADSVNGVAHFEGRSLAIARARSLTVPEAGGPASPGQVGPYTMTGLAWLTDPLGAASSANGFEVTVRGATAVTLDGHRMGLDPMKDITATIKTDMPLVLRLVFGDDVRTYEVAPNL